MASLFLVGRQLPSVVLVIAYIVHAPKREPGRTETRGADGRPRRMRKNPSMQGDPQIRAATRDRPVPKKVGEGFPHGTAIEFRLQPLFAWPSRGHPRCRARACCQIEERGTRALAPHLEAGGLTVDDRLQQTSDLIPT